MNAMDLMKALGDIPEELVKICFDEEFADNKTKAPSGTNSSDLPELADPYQPEETDDDNSTSSNKSGAKHIHFSGYIATVAACLAIVIGLPLIISHFNPKSSISPDDPFVPTQSQRESENPIVTEAKETNTSTTYTNKSNTSLSTAVYSTETTSVHQTTTETSSEHQTTTAITTEENITESSAERNITTNALPVTTERRIDKTTTEHRTMTETTTTTETTTAVPVEKAELKLGVNGNIISDYEGNEAGFPVSGVTDDMKIEYSIADESIAKIVYSDNTNVTVACLKEGTTTLTAKTSDGQTAEMEIVVWPLEHEIW